MANSGLHQLDGEHVVCFQLKRGASASAIAQSCAVLSKYKV